MTNDTTTKYPASEKQISFVTDLLAKREVDAGTLERITDAIADGAYDKVTASRDIDALLSAPSRKVAGKSPMQTLLASVPKSKYAVPVTELAGNDAEDDFKGTDIVFLEIKEFMSTLYARRLHGAPGHFSRSQMTAAQVKALVELISSDPYKYTKLFGDHYTCCGSCGAPLTDARSRELMLGPECRKKFGF